MTHLENKLLLLLLRPTTKAKANLNEPIRSITLLSINQKKKPKSKVQYCDFENKYDNILSFFNNKKNIREDFFIYLYFYILLLSYTLLHINVTVTTIKPSVEKSRSSECKGKVCDGGCSGYLKRQPLTLTTAAFSVYLGSFC